MRQKMNRCKFLTSFGNCKIKYMKKCSEIIKCNYGKPKEVKK